MKPSVDVVIPSYNSQTYLRQAIESVLQQTYPIKQLIVVDDGSTDETRALINRIKDKRIKYVYQQNQGLSTARNTGIKNASSEYIGFLDADDIWLPKKIELQVEQFLISKYHNLGVVYTDFEIIDSQGEKIYNSSGFTFNPKVKGNVSKFLRIANQLAGSGSAVLVKKVCFEEVGYFDESMTASEDWDMWIRIGKEYQVDYVPKVLVQIRRHQHNMQKNRNNMFTHDCIVMAKLHKDKPHTEVFLYNIRYQLIKLILLNRLNIFKFRERVKRANPAFERALLGNPKNLCIAARDVVYIIFRKKFSRGNL